MNKSLAKELVAIAGTAMSAAAHRCDRRALLIAASVFGLPMPTLARAQRAAGVDTNTLEAYPVYSAQGAADGVIRVWGHGNRNEDYIGDLVRSLETAFQKHQPGVTFNNLLIGNASAIGGLYTGVADVALMDRAPLDIDLDGYDSIMKQRPFELSFATGSFSRPHHAAAPVVFVHRANPLRKLTLAQLDAIVGADHRSGTHNIRTWGEVGLKGAWAHRRINLHLPSLTSDASQFVAAKVMGGSRKWTDQLTEYDDVQTAGKEVSAERLVAGALARDRFGLGIANLVESRSGIEPVALATKDGAGIMPTHLTVMERRYPLTRTVSMFANLDSRKSLTPRVCEFARFLLSAQAQSLIAADAGYLPLTAEQARAEWSKLA